MGGMLSIFLTLCAQTAPVPQTVNSTEYLCYFQQQNANAPHMYGTVQHLLVMSDGTAKVITDNGKHLGQNLLRREMSGKYTKAGNRMNFVFQREGNKYEHTAIVKNGNLYFSSKTTPFTFGITTAVLLAEVPSWIGTYNLTHYSSTPIQSVAANKILTLTETQFKLIDTFRGLKTVIDEGTYSVEKAGTSGWNLSFKPSKLAPFKLSSMESNYLLGTLKPPAEELPTLVKGMGAEWNFLMFERVLPIY